jgi:hypothetical protein
MKTFFGLFGIAAPTLLSIAIGVMSMAPPQYEIARGAGIGAAVCTVAACIMWFFITADAIALKIIVGIITGCVTLGGLPVFLSWVSNIESHNYAVVSQVPTPPVSILPQMLATPTETAKNYGVIAPAGQRTLFAVNINDSIPSKLEIGDSGVILYYGGPSGNQSSILTVLRSWLR